METVFRKLASVAVFEAALIIFLIWLLTLPLVLLPLGLIVTGGLLLVSYYAWPPETERLEPARAPRRSSA